MSGYSVKQQGVLPWRNPWASALLLALLLLDIPAFVGSAQARAGGRQVVILVVGYDRAVCNEYGANCRDSELSRAFAATGNALEVSLAATQVQRIDVGQLQLKWLDKTRGSGRLGARRCSGHWTRPARRSAETTAG